MTTKISYEIGGLKNVDYAAKISSLQRTWKKILFDENCHNCESLLLHNVHELFGKKFVFHSNLQVNKKLTKNFPKYYI